MSAIATLDRGSHVYTVAGERVPLCVSDVLRLSGICPAYPDIPSVLNHVEHARELGETVHEWADYLDTTFADGLDPAIDELADSEPMSYVLAYQRFRTEHEPEWSHIEQSFALEDCAGTPDRIGTIKRGKSRIPVIVDIKTPRQAEKHWQIQLSGYQWLANRLDCLLFALHLASDATYKLRPYDSDIGTFCAALRVAQWKLKNNGGKIR
jgi:hypothetical protein